MLPFLQRIRDSQNDNIRFGVSNTLVPYHYPTGKNGNYLPLLMIGEAPGADEEAQGRPFVGASGQLLDQWLKKTGLDRRMFPMLNAFRYRPNGNDVMQFYAPRGDVYDVCEDLSSRNGKYLKVHFRAELEHLKETILDFRPEAVVTLGATALWAILNHEMTITKITADRPDHWCTLEQNGRFARFTLFPAYHPAAVLRGGTQYEATSLRALKAARAFLKPAMY